MTKQGIRDLNYYGPKPAKAAPAARPAAGSAEAGVPAPIVPDNKDAPRPIEA
ncbi:MAG TPA: hypothetical protein VHG72_02645 [Polyangia bacterium]|nr:hypothetical protein [Polyangia bacterium]